MLQFLRIFTKHTEQNMELTMCHRLLYGSRGASRDEASIYDFDLPEEMGNATEGGRCAEPLSSERQPVSQRTADGGGDAESEKDRH